nr:MAG TPA: hypothetical protein [Bacteriophage sp.]DAT11882.1 MAG TPA: hypothetical protein [Herelleviridae sp.]
MLPFVGKGLGEYRIPNINTGFWLKILLANQRITNEIANSKLIDVIQYLYTPICYII